jgi:hypothetical protein
MRGHGCNEEIVLTNNESLVVRHELIVDGVGKSAKYWHGACYDKVHDAVGNYVGDFTLDQSGFHPKMPEAPKDGPWTEIAFGEELRVKKEPWKENFTPPTKGKSDGEA